MRRWIIPLVFALFALPAIACGAGTPTPKAANPTSAPAAATSGTVATATKASVGSVAPAAAASAKPSVAPSVAAAAKVYGLNELVSVKNWDMAVAGVERPGQELVWSQFGNKSTAAGTWLVVAFDMKNTGNQNFGVNTFDFQLTDAGGATYKFTSDFGAASYSTFKGGQSIGGQVPPGVTVRYSLVFDINPAATGLQLVFNQDTKPKFAIGNAAA